MLLSLKEIEELAAIKFPLDERDIKYRIKPITKALNAAGLDRNTWRRWKSGMNSPTMSTMDKLLKVLAR